jgi:hypothetical protein
VVIRRGVGQLADAHCDVLALLDQVDVPVEQQQPHVDLRERAHKRDHDGQHVQPAEHDGRGEREVAAQRAVLAQEPLLGLVEVRDHPTAGLEVAPAGLAQREMPSGAGDQPDADLLLEGHHFAAHGGQRRAQATGCGGEAAGVGNGDEHAHGLQAVHGAFSRIPEGSFPDLPAYRG